MENLEGKVGKVKDMSTTCLTRTTFLFGFFFFILLSRMFRGCPWATVV